MARPIPSPAALEASAERPPVSAEGLRIALYSGNYNSVRDGANKALNRLVGHLLDRGAEVRVYSPVAPEPAFEPVGDLVPVPSMPIPTRSEYRLTFGLARSVKADIRAFRPNLMHLSVPDYTAWQAQNLARSIDVPIVASLHTLFETYFEYYRLGFLRPLSEAYLAKFYSRADLVLTPNAVLADDVSRRSHVRTAIWSRGVDRTLFNPGHRDLAWRRAQGIADDDVAIAFFGRLVLEKGTEIFAEIVQELRRRGRRIVPLVIGDGPEMQRMMDDVGEGVFTGHVEADDLARAVASADVMVNPSVTEAFGNVNLESMSAGVAVVGADVPVVRSMIDDGRTGLVANPTSAADFADKIERLVADRTLRETLAENARKAAAEYDWTAILDAVIAEYHSVVKGHVADGR